MIRMLLWIMKVIQIKNLPSISNEGTTYLLSKSGEDSYKNLLQNNKDNTPTSNSKLPSVLKEKNQKKIVRISFLKRLKYPTRTYSSQTKIILVILITTYLQHQVQKK